MTTEVHSTREKTYVEIWPWGCIARLCKVSAEYYRVDENAECVVPIEITPNSSFEDFQRRCMELYGIEVKEEHRPEVFPIMV